MKETLINSTFLELIRSYRNTFTWNAEGAEDIVFGGLTHQHLITTNIIDKTILDYYTSYTIELLTSSEVNDLPKDYYNAIFSKALAPFPFVILGAYHSRFNLYWKVKALLNPDNKIELNGKNKFDNFFDLESYFSEYAVGFKEGYNDFEDDKIIPYLLKFEKEDREAYAIKILEFLTNNQTQDPKTTSKGGFALFSHERREIVNAYQDGLLEGYIYRAWSIIFSNNELFAPLLKEYLLSKNFIRKIKPELKRDDILKMNNNLIPKITLLYVYDFFSVLLEPNKKGSFYLDEQKLLIFIESTFVNKKPIQQTFNVPFSKDKSDVRSVFRNFYLRCNSFDYDKKNVNRKYFDIMNNAFMGFDDKIDYKKWSETSNEIPTMPKPNGKYLVGKGIN
jgi:hypothetical protein